MEKVPNGIEYTNRVFVRSGITDQWVNKMVVGTLVICMEKIKFNSYLIPLAGLKTQCVEQYFKNLEDSIKQYS